MAINVETAVKMFKQAKDMMQGINAKDDYIVARIEDVISDLKTDGIHLVDTASDLMLVVDIAVWRYNSRDKNEPMKKELKDRKNTRWLKDRKINADYAAKLAEEAEGNADDP